MSSDTMPHSFLPSLLASDTASPRHGEGFLWRASDFFQRIEGEYESPPLLPFVPITLLLEWNENFYEELRRIYLHGIYGRFSLLVKGVLSHEDFANVLSLCHRLFCELSEENREFNGYLPRGILVDSPLALCWQTLPSGADFYCLDYHRLVTLWSGEYTDRGREDAERRMTQFLGRIHPSEAKILFGREPDKEACRFLLQRRAEEIFLPDQSISAIRERIRGMMGEREY